MPISHASCDICGKNVSLKSKDYVIALCNVHVLCYLCSTVFKDGTYERPICPKCSGEAAVNERDNARRNAAAQTASYTREESFQPDANRFRQEQILLNEIKEQFADTGGVQNEYPEKQSTLKCKAFDPDDTSTAEEIEFYYKTDPNTGKQFKHFPYRPKKRTLSSQANSIPTRKLICQINDVLPTNYGSDPKSTSFTKMLKQKSEDISYINAKHGTDYNDFLNQELDMFHTTLFKQENATRLEKPHQKPDRGAKKHATSQLVSALISQKSSSSIGLNDRSHSPCSDTEIDNLLDSVSDIQSDKNEDIVIVKKKEKKAISDWLLSTSQDHITTGHFQYNPSRDEANTETSHLQGGLTFDSKAAGICERVHGMSLGASDEEEEERCTSPIKGNRRVLHCSWLEKEDDRINNNTSPSGRTSNSYHMSDESADVDNNLEGSFFAHSKRRRKTDKHAAGSD